jgi:hypothetical protein
MNMTHNIGQHFVCYREKIPTIRDNDDVLSNDNDVDDWTFLLGDHIGKYHQENCDLSLSLFACTGIFSSVVTNRAIRSRASARGANDRFAVVVICEVMDLVLRDLEMETNLNHNCCMR